MSRRVRNRRNTRKSPSAKVSHILSQVTNNAVHTGNKMANAVVNTTSNVVTGTTGLAKDAVMGTASLTKDAVVGTAGLAKDAVVGTAGLAKKAVVGTANLTKNVAVGTANLAKDTVVSTVHNTATAVGDTVDYGENLSVTFIDALQDVVSGLVDGAGTIVDTTGRVVERMLTDVFDVRATHVFNGAGRLAKQIAYQIGGVVRLVPYVGNVTGYIVESAGGGVYHVILSVGKLIGNASRRLGKVAKKTSDLLVFTLNASNDQLKDSTHTVDDLVRRLSRTLTTREGKSLRQSGGRRGKYRRTRRVSLRSRSRSGSRTRN